MTGLTQSRQPPRRLAAGILLFLLAFTATVYVRYAVQYVHLMQAISELPYRQADSNQRIVAVVRDISKTRPVRSVAIWGWAPGVYVLTGIPPATRDAIGFSVITKGPYQQYFQDRFLGDLRSNPPDMFIDAVAVGAFLWWDWTANDGYESDPDVRKFVDDNYLPAGQLTLLKGEKPVRFFILRTPWSK